MSRLSGYRELREIHQGPRYVVFRARRSSDGLSVVLKTTRPDRADGDPGAQLGRERELLAQLDVPGVVRALGLEELAGRPALILEDAGPQSLAERLLAGPLSTGEFLDIATRLAGAVARIHQRNVIHRDLNPANVVLDDNGYPTVIDFHVATTVTGMLQSGVPGGLEGTLAYLAPEQTGRLGRLVDHRADLYALGATFDEMLTGSPPFPSTDPLELVHAHLARMPVPPSEARPGVPRLLSDLVMRLLAKLPERRYQTAEAVEADLDEARRRFLASGEIPPFELGRRDVQRELVFPDELYGRERQRAELAAALARALAGGRELVLVTGAAGSGKSALIQGFGRPAAHDIVFLYGKHQQLRGEVPHAPLVEALRGLARGILAEPPEIAAAWRSRIRSALGPNAGVLIDIVPELEHVVGERPDVPAVGPMEAESRFRSTFLAFIRALAAPERPLVLCLDDLHWADPATIKLLAQLLADPDARHLLVVVAYRSEEVDPLADEAPAIRQAGTAVTRIELGPLDLPAVTALLADLLRCEPDRAAPLGRVLLGKTGGNPLFLRGILRLLHRTGSLSFDAVRGVWEWDNAEIGALPLAEDVVTLMLAVLRRLPARAREVLKVAACLGGRVDLWLLAAAAGLPPGEAAGALWSAIREGLLVPAAEGPLRAPPPALAAQDPSAAGASYRFVHDRVEQAAYSLLAEEERRAIHLEVGRTLLRSAASDEELEDRIFDVVDQLELGRAAMHDPSERRELAALCHRAGRKALRSSAFAAAFTYLQRGLDLLPEGAWDAHHDLAFRLHRDAAESGYLAGDFARSAELVEAALPRARSPLEEAALHSVRVVAETNRGDYAAALRWGREALRLCGMELPEGPLSPFLPRELAATRELLGARSAGELLDLAPMTRPEDLAAMQLLSTLKPMAWYSDPDLYAMITLRAVQLTLRAGHALESAHAYADYALFLTGAGEVALAYEHGRMAVELAGRYGNPAEECKVTTVFAAVIQPWREPLRACIPLLQRACVLGMQSGDLPYVALARFWCVHHHFRMGEDLSRVLPECESALGFVRSVGHKVATMLLLAVRQTIRCLQGRTAASGRFDDADFDEEGYLAENRDERTIQWHYWSLRLQAAYLAGDLAGARAAARAVEGNTDQRAIPAGRADQALYTALTLAALAGVDAPEQRAGALAEIEAHRRLLEAWAEGSPQSFRHKHLLVAAEAARLRGQHESAADLHDQAIEAAGRAGFLQDEALALELCGRAHALRGRRRVAVMYLDAALAGYARWGATAKVEALREQLAGLGYQARQRSPTSPGASGQQLDLEAALRAVETLSREVELSRLLAELMRICLEAAGAQRAVLVLEEDGALFVRAQGSATEPVWLGKMPLREAQQILPRRIIEHVRATGEALVLGDAAQAGAFVADPYVAERGTRSVLATLIRRQERSIGVLYLENDLIPQAFRPERVRLLGLLSSQIAISIENSLMFEALRREVEEREKAVRLRDEFLSVASHELNTPITSLQLSIQSLLRGAGALSPESLSRLLERADRQTRRLTRLVDQLLSVSRIQAGAVSLELEPLDLAAVVGEIVERSSEDIARSGSRVSTRADKPVRGLWDRLRLEQIVANLLSNALKFGAGGPIEIEVDEMDGEGRLAVRDHGIGIPPERLPYIFGRFERAVSVRSYGGLGLGLYIARCNVDALGGSIQAESTPGAGTELVVRLPRAGPRAVAAGPAALSGA